MLRPYVVAALVLATTDASAQVVTDIIRSPAVPRRVANRYAVLDVSRIGDRADVDLFCPHTSEPSPLVVIVPDSYQRRIELGGVAAILASSAFVVAVVDPPAPSGTTDARRLGTLVDELVAAPQLDAREVGCTLAPGVTVLGVGRSATMALELARLRGTNAPLSAVVTAYLAEPPVYPNAPVLAIETAAVFALPPHHLIVMDGNACDFDDDGCRGVRGIAPTYSIMAGRDRLTEVLSRTATWLHATVENDPLSMTKLQTWDARVEVADDWSERYVHSRHTFFGIPFELGFTSQGNGFTYGVRPQLVRAWLVEGTRRDTQRHGYGVGAYADLARANGSAILGGGLTVTRYDAPFAISPALGFFHRSDDTTSATGVAVGIAAGFRNFIDLDHLDFPHELRVEGHFGVGSIKESSVTITLELDTALMITAVTTALAGIISIGS